MVALETPSPPPSLHLGPAQSWRETGREAGSRASSCNGICRFMSGVTEQQPSEGQRPRSPRLCSCSFPFIAVSGAIPLKFQSDDPGGCPFCPFPSVLSTQRVCLEQDGDVSVTTLQRNAFLGSQEGRPSLLAKMDPLRSRAASGGRWGRGRERWGWVQRN